MPELLCPVCGQILTGTERTYICPGGHSFDRGKGGYVNLLISHQSGTQHGDDKAMVRARREFLDTGCYAPLQQALCRAVLRYVPAEGTADLVDAGCGECYYTAAVEQALLATGKMPSIVGVDISKDALRFGGKRGQGLTLAVASAYHVPVKDASCDVVLNVFAPFAGEEYRRILKPGGVLLHVSPDEEHLWELKQVLYETPYRNDAAAWKKQGNILRRCAAGKQKAHRITVWYSSNGWSLPYASVRWAAWWGRCSTSASTPSRICARNTAGCSG